MCTSSNEDNKQNVLKWSTTHPSNPWLSPTNPLVEHDLVWGKYIDPITRCKPISKVGIEKIECEANGFHHEWMNNPPKMGSLKYWAQVSFRYPMNA